MAQCVVQVQALQFEWAWQHPEKSKALRDLVAELKGTRKSAGITGAKGKVICTIIQLKDGLPCTKTPEVVTVLECSFAIGKMQNQIYVNAGAAAPAHPPAQL